MIPTIDDELYQRVYVKELKAGTCANNIFETKEGKRRLRGSYITHINGKHVFNVQGATAKLQDLYDDYKSHVQGGVRGNNNSTNDNFSFSITFSPE